MSARDLQFVRLMNRGEFREYLDEHAPSGSVVESFAKAFVSRNSSAHLLATLIENGFIDVNAGFREDFMQHRVYGAKDRWTLLHLAVFEDAIEIARTLLDLGATVDASSGESYGQTPLHGAVSAEMADLLLKRGARVDSRDRFGATPLFRAVVDGVALGERKERLALIETLLAAGADPSIPRPWPAGNPLAKTAGALTMTDAISRKTDDYSKRVLGLLLTKNTSS